MPRLCNRMLGLLACTALAALTTAPLGAQQPRPRQGELKVGDAAPDFSVKDVQGKDSVQLADLKDKPVVLIFGSCT